MRTSHLDLAWRPNRLGHPRLAGVVRRFEFSAVARHRLRRRVKEILRRDALAALPPVDLVLRAKRGAYAVSFAALRADVRELVGRVT